MRTPKYLYVRLEKTTKADSGKVWLANGGGVLSLIPRPWPAEDAIAFVKRQLGGWKLLRRTVNTIRAGCCGTREHVTYVEWKARVYKTTAEVQKDPP